jgi:hypothetical protein
MDHARLVMNGKARRVSAAERRLASLQMQLWGMALPWVFLVSTSLATTPFGNTFIVKRNGTWHCPQFYTRDLMIADEDKGTRHEVPLNRLFAGAEYQANVSRTTAGPRWGDTALSFIAPFGGRDFFYMHCWTGKRLLVALDTGKIEKPGRLANQLADEEWRQALATLTNAVTNLRAGQSVSADQLHAAILIAAARGAKEVRAWLEAIEALDGGSGHLGFISDYSYGPGLGEGFQRRSYVVAQHRRFAQLGLRRLGIRPQGYPAIIFEEARAKASLAPAARAANLASLRQGQYSREVCQLLGPPDYLETAVDDKAGVAPAAWKRKWIDAWRYDFTLQPDCSILIIWKDGGRIERIERVKPGLWHGESLFTTQTGKRVVSADGSVNGIHLYSSAFSGTVEVLVPQSSPSAPTGSRP